MSDLSAQMAEQVKSAAADGTGLVISAGNSKRGLIGRSLSGQPLDVSGHTGIVSYRPTELILTARAGTRLSEIEAVIAENNQCLAFEPPLFGGDATLGGTLACNLSGPARPWFGSIRDAVLGLRLINGVGDHLRFGGEVIKNVAGYDVTRLQAGALGSFGVLAEISLKVLPRPEASKTVSRAMDRKSALAAMNAMAGSSMPLSGAAWWDGRLYLRMSGAPSSIDAAFQNLGYDSGEEEEGLWLRLRELTLPVFQSEAPLVRTMTKTTTAVARDDDEAVIDWGGAVRWSTGNNAAQSVLDRPPQDGHALLFKGGDRTAEVRSPVDASIQALKQRLKLAFDPKNILNRGVLYSWM